MRGAKALRRPEALDVAVGGVHHGVGLPLGAQDQVALPDAGGAGVRQVGLQVRFDPFGSGRHWSMTRLTRVLSSQPQGRAQDGVGHVGGEAADPRAVRGADHAGLQVQRRVAAVGRALAAAAHPLAAPQPRRRGQDGGLRPPLKGEGH